MTGLENVKVITDNLLISHCDALTDLTGLNGLKLIKARVEISQNDSLVSLSGLDKLATIGANFYIDDNMSLESLNGLEALTAFDGQLWLDNPAQRRERPGDHGLDTLHLEGNDSLVSLTGFEGLTTLDDELYVYWNNDLTDIEPLFSLQSVGGDFTFSYNDSLSRARAEALRDTIGLGNIGGTVKILGGVP
ncbi:MAG: hypothetical protein IPN01_27800 [Deltaproteobacteria bacterium]|nr:hypothetical protein [Deltaproteobacteria bacterium]